MAPLPPTAWDRLRQHGRFDPDRRVSASALPDGPTLLQLEHQVRRTGSGLEAADLIGCWQPLQVWPRRGTQPNPLVGLLLRSLGARLEISGEAESLRICNAVRLAGLELRFRGRATLRGRRPLLCFSFAWLELALADRVLLRRPLPEPEVRRMPFFALIGRDPCGWLAARGRGGGLALWCLKTDAAAPQPAERQSGSGADRGAS